jgi:hypothetical protein
MDKFEPQSVGHVKEGHEESDISIRGIVWFGVFLAAGGVSAFVLMIGMIWGMEKWERSREPKLTPMEQQMLDERAATNQGVGQTLGEHDVTPVPDWFGRGKMEDHLSRTFKDTSPRLQYDDEHDMRGFVGSEEKCPFQPANVGAPSAAYPSGAASTGQPASAPAGGVKK